MEEEKKEESSKPYKKRKVSLFRRRKKPDLRPFIREKKHREYKKTLSRFLIVVPFLFLIAALLFGVQKFVIPKLLEKNTNILVPQEIEPQTNSQIKQIIVDSFSDITNVNFSTSSAVVTYLLHGNTLVYLSLEKDVKQQLSLVEAIDRQIMNDGKQAISIDLRYNKPIVKY